MANRYCVLGYPLGHTMSPPIHRRLFELAGIEAEYLTREIPPEELPRAVPELLALSGFNITIPHKLAIMPFLGSLSEEARRYGAVNCVKCGGIATGYNTDVIGFTRSVEALGATLDGRVAVLGCGGAGRMMAIEAALRGASVTLAVRPSGLDRAQGVRDDVLRNKPGADVAVTTLDRLTGGFDLLVNATPVGMYPHGDASPVPEETLDGVSHMFDAIYNPVETPLMRAARARGIPAAGGMAMLVWQAAAAHELWDGSRYAQADIEALTADMERQVAATFR